MDSPLAPESDRAAPSEIVRTAAPPAEIGGYRILEVLREGQSWLAQAPAGRRVVLKAMDEDSLWKRQLHPSIKDRLSRVRELAHTGVANLYGVERDAGLVYMVWEYVPGVPLDEFAESKSCSSRDFLLIARELVLAVETLHARGIIHGAVSGPNVIIANQGRSVTLTHVSPWLYTDPEGDLNDVLDLLTELLDRRGEADSALAVSVQLWRDEGRTLREIGGKLGGLIEAREPGVIDLSPEEEVERQVARRVRRRSVAGAAGLLVGGVMMFAGVWYWGWQRHPRPATPGPAPAGAFEPVSRSAAAPTRPPGPPALPTPMPPRDPVSLK